MLSLPKKPKKWLVPWLPSAFEALVIWRVFTAAWHMHIIHWRL